jgi:hypothetical protein
MNTECATPVKKFFNFFQVLDLAGISPRARSNDTIAHPQTVMKTVIDAVPITTGIAATTTGATVTIMRAARDIAMGGGRPIGGVAIEIPTKAATVVMADTSERSEAGMAA